MDLQQLKEATIINITMASTAKATALFPAEDDGAIEGTIEGTNATIAAAATAAVDTLNNNNNNTEENEHSSNDDVSVASDITDVAIAVADEQENHFDEDINAAPGHLHALTGVTNPRLRGRPGMTRHNSDGKLVSAGGGGGGSIGGSTRSIGGSIGRSTRSMGEPGQQQVKGGRRSRSTSRSVGGGRRSANSSRSSSPLPANKHHEGASGEVGSHGVGGKGAGDSSTAYSAAHSQAQSVHSGYSSLDGMFDPDLLLDRLGFIDLDPPLPHEIRCGPLAAPGTIDGKSNNSGGLTPVNERLSEETLDDCHAFNDLVMIENVKHLSAHGGGMSSTLSMPSVAHSSLSGMRSDMSVGSLSVGSFKGGAHSRGV
mmetsp:Transcript_8568/g.13534  ORF Transcript_8568/g.13534 Transcript_8568/m.13534 type:complete len:370 (+) Transcript_8568:67-1176(+)